MKPTAGRDADGPVTCVCGRLLRDPASRVRGLGPVCARRLQGRTAPRPSIASPTNRSEPIPGQTELPLVEHQPTLWSI
ncbi:DUF6011 domain-containing protein [Streptomyces sp. NBC_01549]|uniref:DUF6011 domain-containing protein n=1 Tax=Streptomyces sp. NBC_01549 TaxID=2975874 RepID=UPI00338F249D